MRSIIVIIGAAFLLAACQTPPPAVSAPSWPKGIHPPVAVKKPHDRFLFGDTVRDNYYWMVDYFSKGPDSSLAVDYLKAENAYLDSMMSGSSVFREKLFGEMKARIKEAETDPPVFKNGYYYYVRKEKGQQYFKYYRRKGDTTAAEELLLDVDKMAAGHPYFSVGAMQVSPDNRLMAFCVDSVSRRQYSIYIKDLASGQVRSNVIDGAAPGIAWANDNRTLFYTRNNPVTLLTEKIMRHTLGTPAGMDKVV
jgi:oligopeptidase B